METGRDIGGIAVVATNKLDIDDNNKIKSSEIDIKSSFP